MEQTCLEQKGALQTKCSWRSAPVERPTLFRGPAPKKVAELLDARGVADASAGMGNLASGPMATKPGRRRLKPRPLQPDVYEPVCALLEVTCIPICPHACACETNELARPSLHRPGCDGGARFPLQGLPRQCVNANSLQCTAHPRDCVDKAHRSRLTSTRLTTQGMCIQGAWYTGKPSRQSRHKRLQQLVRLIVCPPLSQTFCPSELESGVPCLSLATRRGVAVLRTRHPVGKRPNCQAKEYGHDSPVSASCRSHAHRKTVRRASSYETSLFHDFAFENGGADDG